MAEHWRLLGAATDDSGWPEWAGWLLEGSSGAVLQAGSADRTLETWVQLIMTEVGLSGMAGCWRPAVGVPFKLFPLVEHWRLLGAADDD